MAKFLNCIYGFHIVPDKSIRDTEEWDNISKVFITRFFDEGIQWSYSCNRDNKGHLIRLNRGKLVHITLKWKLLISEPRIVQKEELEVKRKIRIGIDEPRIVQKEELEVKKKIRIGIDGFKRIGQMVARAALQSDDIELVGINEPVIPMSTMIDSFNKDNGHKRWDHHNSHQPQMWKNDTEDYVFFNEHQVNFYRRGNDEGIPWKTVGADIVVVEYGNLDAATRHLEIDLKVLILAPCDGAPTFVVGANDGGCTSDVTILSCGSYAITCIAPLAKVLHEEYGISLGSMDIWESVTGVSPENVGPPLWGDKFSKEIAEVVPELKGILRETVIQELNLDDPDIRLTFFMKEEVSSYDDVMEFLWNISETTLEGILFCPRPNTQVQKGFPLGDGRSCIVCCGDVVKKRLTLDLMYDAEWSYSKRVIELIRRIPLKDDDA